MSFIALLLFFHCGSITTDYNEIFAEDYARALDFQAKHEMYFDIASKQFHVEARFLKSIVFPELIRFSYFRNMIETETLEWLYVTGGSRSADFSIGHFQMKPSFVEELERCVSSVESLNKKYGFILLEGNGSPYRSQRLERLKNLSWQLVYLCCFVDAASYWYKDEKFSDDRDKLKFYCTVYNAGFIKDSATLRLKMNGRTFPYGADFGNNQYSYSDIALDYYLRHAVN